MTWTKLGDEFPAEARELTSDEFRLHVEALCWSNKRLLDLLVPKRELRRLSELDDPEEAARGLVAKDWWEGRGDAWFVGVCFPEWQQDRAQVEHRREQLRIIQDRKRKHARGDHSLCLRGRCPSASPPSSDDTSDDTSDESSTAPGRVGTGLSAPTDPLLDQSQNPSQTPGGTFPPGPLGQPPSSADRDISGGARRRRGTVPPEGAEGAAFEDSNPSLPAPVKTGSVAKSQNRRLPDGSETVADDAQESPPNRAERSGADRYAGACEAEPPANAAA